MLTKFKKQFNPNDQFRLRLANFFGGAVGASRWLARIGVVIAPDPWTRQMMVGLAVISERAIKTAKAYQKQVKKQLSAINDHNSALNNIVKIQHLNAKRFLKEFPAANLAESEVER
jgi:hypothetical protein